MFTSQIVHTPTYFLCYHVYSSLLSLKESWCNKINEAEKKENQLTIGITGRTISCSPQVERKVSDDMA